MEISTRKFGSIEIEESRIITMSEGVLGFQMYEKFVLLTDSKTEPVFWFQSVEEPDLCIIFMEPYLFDPDYKLNLNEFIAQRGWEGAAPEDLDVYVAVYASNEDEQPKVIANLMGPVIINSKHNEAFQAVITNTGYSSKNILGKAA